MAQSKTTQGKGRGGRGGGSRYEVGIKLGLESTGGSKGGGTRLTIEPELRKRRRRESNRRRSRKRVRSRGLDDASPAVRRMTCGAAVFAVRHGTRILVLSEKGALGFLRQGTASELLAEWRRNESEELIGTVIETAWGSRPICLDLRFTGTHQETRQPVVEVAAKSGSGPLRVTTPGASSTASADSEPRPSPEASL